jgi:nucleoside-diphosphate-sugar epimerase
VTGANGYIASHLIGLLLDRGYRVRGTVRDPSNEAKTTHLKAIAAGRDAADRLELVAGDLLKPGSFDDAIAGCDGVFHTAAAVLFAADDPQKSIVDPSVDGTRNVFASIAAAGTVKRVVHTSSVAAIYSFDKPNDYLYTEADWNDSSTVDVDAYGLAKVAAEREALKLAAQVPEGARYELVHLNPGMVWGPPLIKAHAKASPLLIRDLVSGLRPGVPRMHLGIVDVRDVAAVHLQAMEKPGVSGRYILVADHAWLPEVAAKLQQLFPDLKIPTRTLPNLLVLAVALIDAALNFAQLRKLLGLRLEYDPSRAEKEFDITFRSLDETLRETAEPMIANGWARTKKR